MAIFTTMTLCHDHGASVDSGPRPSFSQTVEAMEQQPAQPVAAGAALPLLLPPSGHPRRFRNLVELLLAEHDLVVERFNRGEDHFSAPPANSYAAATTVGGSSISKEQSRSMSTDLWDEALLSSQGDEVSLSTSTILYAWRRMTEQILEFHHDHQFRVRDCWSRSSNPATFRTSAASSALGLPMLFKETDETGDDIMEKLWHVGAHTKVHKRSRHSAVYTSDRTLDYRFMLHPDSFARMLWAFVGLGFIVLDIFFLTMAVYGLERPNYVSLIDCLYWSADVGVNFCIGTYHNDRLVMRRSLVAHQYMRTWLAPDALLVIIQWVLHLLDAGQPGTGLIRYVRLTRFLRLLRLAKFNRSLRQLLLQSQARWVNLALKVALYLLSVAVWVHVSGTMFYWIGDQEGGWTREDPSLQTLPLSYLTSVHWAASQLQGGIDVYPARERINERSFAVVNLLASIAVLAMVVSKVTNVLHAMQIANRDRNRMTLTARRFMERNDIRSELSLQIYRYLAKREVLKARMGDDEDEREMLHRLPVHLRRTLLQEARWPMVRMHVIFTAFASASEHFKQLLLCDVLQSSVFLPDDVIFQYGSICSRMYILVYGECHYLRYARTFASLLATGGGPKSRDSVRGGPLLGTNSSSPPSSATDEGRRESVSSAVQSGNLSLEGSDASQEDGFQAFQRRHRQLQGCTLSNNTTLAEAGLWTNWAHVGDFEAINETPMFTIGVGPFGELVSNFVTVQKDFRTHAQRFVDHLKNSDGDRYSDLLCTEMVMDAAPYRKHAPEPTTARHDHPGWEAHDTEFFFPESVEYRGMKRSSAACQCPHVSVLKEEEEFSLDGEGLDSDTQQVRVGV